MNKNVFQKIVLIALAIAVVIALIAPAIFGQTGQPRQEKLLNGLRVLMWQEPASDKVSVRLRIHSGSAFDPQGKEGTMQMLADNLFPNEAAREFFTDDLGGSLQITSNYDYIEINASSTSSQYLSMLETIASVIANPPIDKETTTKLKTAMLARIAASETDPAYVADHAVAKRLFGTFPYGRPRLGTPESVQKIEFADLIEAQKRFLTADNATLAMSGNFPRAQGFAAVRRYFGSWLKSDRKTPSTFRQPDNPEVMPLLIPVAGNQRTHIRYALRGVARNDPGFEAVQVLSKVLFERLKRDEPANSPNQDFSVRHDARFLPGYLTFSHTFPNRSKISPSYQAPGTFTVLSGPPDGSMGKHMMLTSKAITEAEFAQAKNAWAAERASKTTEHRWLDIDTYKLSRTGEDDAFLKMSLADVQRVADELAKNPVVTVIVHGVGDTNPPSKN